VLDHLIAAGVADPERVAACGTSRGGFAALHFAAADPRVKCVAAFAPATDLGALSEFRGAGDHPLAARLALQRRDDDLAGRAVWLVIGDRDERVGTDHVVSEPRGHATPAGAAEQGAKWIEQQVRRRK
jgi:dienelactone hydrolase